MKIFIDTAPFIYLIENHPIHSEKVKNYIANSISKGDQLVTSVVTLMEFGVKPAKENRQDVIDKFEELLNRLGIKIIEIDKNISTSGYQIRAKYEFLKGMDALQLASAIKNECNSFLTNDKKLEKVKEIKIILVKDL